MFLIQAPYPAIEATIVLPNPQFSDARARTNSMNLQRSMDGGVYTYVKKTTLERVSYSFKLSRFKAEEVRQFLKYYQAEPMQFINHKDEIWRVHLTNDPVTLTYETLVNLAIDAEGYKV